MQHLLMQFTTTNYVYTDIYPNLFSSDTFRQASTIVESIINNERNRSKVLLSGRVSLGEIILRLALKQPRYDPCILYVYVIQLHNLEYQFVDNAKFVKFTHETCVSAGGDIIEENEIVEVLFPPMFYVVDCRCIIKAFVKRPTQIVQSEQLKIEVDRGVASVMFSTMQQVEEFWVQQRIDWDALINLDACDNNKAIITTQKMATQFHVESNAWILLRCVKEHQIPIWIAQIVYSVISKKNVLIDELHEIPKLLAHYANLPVSNMDLNMLKIWITQNNECGCLLWLDCIIPNWFETIKETMQNVTVDSEHTEVKVYCSQTNIQSAVVNNPKQYAHFFIVDQPQIFACACALMMACVDQDLWYRINFNSFFARLEAHKHQLFLLNNYLVSELLYQCIVVSSNVIQDPPKLYVGIYPTHCAVIASVK